MKKKTILSALTPLIVTSGCTFESTRTAQKEAELKEILKNENDKEMSIVINDTRYSICENIKDHSLHVTKDDKKNTYHLEATDINDDGIPDINSVEYPRANKNLEVCTQQIAPLELVDGFLVKTPKIHVDHEIRYLPVLRKDLFFINEYRKIIDTLHSKLIKNSK